MTSKVKVQVMTFIVKNFNTSTNVIATQTGAAEKFVTMAPYQETIEERGGYTQSSSLILNATGCGLVTFCPTKQCVKTKHNQLRDDMTSVVMLDVLLS